MIFSTGLRLRLLGLLAASLAAGLLIAIPAAPVLKLSVLGVLSLGSAAVLVLRSRKDADPPVLPPPAAEPEPEEPVLEEEIPVRVEESIPSAQALSALSSLRADVHSLRQADEARLSSVNKDTQTYGTGDDKKLELATIKASADFITDNILRAFEISDNLANTAKTAFELSESVQKGVTIVTDALTHALTQTGILFDQSKQISKIIEIMSEISEKIHILSINASIVSARAGTAGKGFEVVAKEIRSLARETEKSLEEIEQVVVDVQSTINSVVERVDTASRQTNSEQQNLISVAGSLQGVILGVEIILAVTSVAKEKAEEQQVTMQTWLGSGEAPAEDLEDLEELPDSTSSDLLQKIDQDLEALEAIIKERP